MDYDGLGTQLMCQLTRQGKVFMLKQNILGVAINFPAWEEKGSWLHNDHELLQWKVAYQKQPDETPVSYVKHFSCTWQALLRRNCLVQREIQRRNERAKAMHQGMSIRGEAFRECHCFEVKLSFHLISPVARTPRGP